MSDGEVEVEASLARVAGGEGHGAGVVAVRERDAGGGGAGQGGGDAGHHLAGHAGGARLVDRTSAATRAPRHRDARGRLRQSDRTAPAR